MLARTTRTIAAVLAIAVASAEALAQDEVPCGPRGTVVAGLTRQYGEAPTGIGIAANGGVVEHFASPDGATWTLVITLPNGLTCHLMDGESWEKLPLQVAGRSS